MLVSPDYTPPATLTGATFEDQSRDAFVRIPETPASFSDPELCGAFPCTGMNNILITFDDASFTGTTVPDPAMPEDFVIISKNDYL